MRTTLKRGVGRAAAANGNGHAVFPPAPLTPVTIYRQELPKTTRRHAVGRVLLWLTAGLMMLALAAVGGAYVFAHERVNDLHPHSKDVKEAAKQLAPVPLPGHAAIALLVGYDHRAGKESALGSRSDTIMLLRTDPGTKSV